MFLMPYKCPLRCKAGRIIAALVLPMLWKPYFPAKPKPKGSLSPSQPSSKSFRMRTSLIRLAKGFGELPLTGGVGIRGVTK